MEIEKISNLPDQRRGVAMFAVLGAIVLVTLLGAVGLTLADKDRQLSGDLSALKSADEMGLAGLRLAVNRLEADPANLVAQLNGFIVGKAANQWLKLDAPGGKVQLQSADPDWFYLNPTDPNDKSAVKVRILAISLGDTSNVPSIDLSNVYISLECQATGRQDDRRTATATYHIQGVSLSTNSEIRQFRIPDYALYLGGGLETSNLRADITGDVYVNGANGTFFNGNATHTIQGSLKWDGDFSSNAPLTVDSNVFIGGSITLNSSAPITFMKNLGVGGGLKQMNSQLKVYGNLWLGSSQPPVASNWNPGGKLVVDSNLVWVASSAMAAGDSVRVLGNAWFLSGISTGNGGYLNIGKSLYVHDSAGFAFKTDLGASLHVGHNLIVNVNAMGKFKLTGTANRVGDTLAIPLAVDNGELLVDSAASYAPVTSTGKITNPTLRSPGPLSVALLKSLYPAPPTPAQLGLDTNLMKTSVAANPMDSVKLDNTNSPEAFAHIVDVTPQLLLEANIKSSVLNPTNLNRLYTYLDSTRRTFNGYMVLRLGSDAAKAFTSSADDPTGFLGKAIFQVVAPNTNLTYWPHSHDSTNIQVIDIEAGGELGAWGWTYNDFAGIFYWSDPPTTYCTSNKTFNFPATGRFLGSIIIGNSKTCKGPRITPNDGAISIIRFVPVYLDIGKNLPGVLRPAVVNGTSRTMTSVAVTKMTSSLRLTTSKPFFQKVSIFR